MAQQTINVGAAPNDGTGTPLRTAFQYTNSNFTELYTALGGGSGLPGASSQVIFNDGGTNLAGSAGLVFNKTTSVLGVGTVNAGAAIVSGDLTVATSGLKVDSLTGRIAINTATFATGAIGVIQSSATRWAGFNLNNSAGTLGGSIGLDASGSGGGSQDLTVLAVGTNLSLYSGNNLQFKIAHPGVFTWYDGTGGTRMTLNSTGLGVGVASPTQKLHVKGVVNLEQISGGTNVWQVYTYTDGTYRLNYNGSGSDELIIDTSGNVGIKVEPSAWNSSYRGLQLGAGGAISAHTSTSLPWLVATSNSFINSAGDWKFINNGYSTRYLARGDDGTQSWWTSNNGSAGDTVAYTQAMTLDASGNLLVKKTAVSSTTLGVELLATGQINGATANQDNLNIYNTTAAAYRFYVNAAGTVFATNTTISAISDARFKENVQDIDVGLGAILALKPRKFDWKDGKGKNIKGDRGFIAQEFETVFPNLIDEWKENAPEGEAPYKSVRQDLIPVLVKAIQELTARVQTLETR